MIISQWYDPENKVTRNYIELTPIQAERLIKFLQKQLKEFPLTQKPGNENLTEKCFFQKFNRNGSREESRGMVTIVIV